MKYCSVIPSLTLPSQEDLITCEDGISICQCPSFAMHVVSAALNKVKVNMLISYL